VNTSNTWGNFSRERERGRGKVDSPSFFTLSLSPLPSSPHQSHTMPKYEGPEWDQVDILEDLRKKGGCPRVKCHLEFWTGASRIRHHHVGKKGSGIACCRGGPAGADMSPEDRQLAAAAVEEVRLRLQETEDKLHASKQDSCRKHHLEQLTRTSAAAAKQPAQTTIEQCLLRKDRAAVDSLFAEFMFSSGAGTPFAITCRTCWHALCHY